MPNPVTPIECNPFREEPTHTISTQELWTPPDLHSVTGITRIEPVIGIGFLGIGQGYNYYVLPPPGYLRVKSIGLHELRIYPNALQDMKKLLKQIREPITDVIRGTGYGEGYFIVYGKPQPTLTDFSK